MGLKDVVIVGAGPAGLTAAYALTRAGVRSLTAEKSKRVGGIARTENYKGYRIDIGGHRFFTKVNEVDAMWHEILGADFLERPRLSRIYYNRRFIAYPLRVINALTNLGLLESGLVLASYLASKFFPYQQEETFEEWVSNRFGRRLFRIFFKSYTEKVWGIPCDQISAKWAAQRIQSLSLPRAVWNAIFSRNGNGVTSLIQHFHYPRLGPGMLWERTAQIVSEQGSEVCLNTEVLCVHHQRGRVIGVTLRRDGIEERIDVDALISTMPISELIVRLDPPAPIDVRQAASRLTYRDFLTVALIVNRADLFPDNWIYVHAPEVQVARIQNFKNWSADMVPDPRKSCLGLEYFCMAGDALWRMRDADLIELGKQELARIGLVNAPDVEDGVVFRQAKAYPVYTGEFEAHLKTIRRYLDTIGNLQTIGRNGLHMYNNQDHSMLTAMLAVRNLLGEHHDVWSVNVERAYHEEVRVPSQQPSAVATLES